MNLLCDLISSKIKLESTRESGNKWRLRSESEQSCVAETEEVVLYFFFDDRIGTIESSIEFANTEIQYADRLYSHIIRKIFNPCIDWRDIQDTDDISMKVDREVDNVLNILSAAQRQHILPRDFFYFQLGYNAAYTKYMSGGYRDMA